MKEGSWKAAALAAAGLAAVVLVARWTDARPEQGVAADAGATQREDSVAVPVLPPLRGATASAAAADARAVRWLEEAGQLRMTAAERSSRGALVEGDLRRLAEGGDALAKELLAARLALTDSNEALRLALEASEAGRPMGAVIASEIAAGVDNHAAEGLMYLDAFEQRHGPNPLLARYRKHYLAIHALTEQEIRSQPNLLEENEARGRMPPPP